MSKISKIKARQIFDSRGNPTVEVDILTDDGILGRAAVPSGASTGEHEAVELRDGGKDYMGKGVLNAVSNVNNVLAKELIGLSVFDQENIDNLMIKIDGTPNKAKLGANAILGVSLALAKAASNSKGISLHTYISNDKSTKLPVPMMNIINGGSHSDAPIAFQEFMIMPVEAESFTQAMKIGSEIFHNLKKILSDRGLTTSVGDEGGFAPKLDGTEDALNTIIKAIEKSGYQAGKQVMIALDCASSEFYKNGMYDYSIFEGKDGKVLNSNQQAKYLADLSSKFPIVSIEDGMDENDWDGWAHLTKICGDRVQIVGDDLFVTNVERLNKGIENNIANSILIKVNQIGTLTETINAVNMAHAAGFTSVMSHRSGETEDNTIADLAVGLSTGQIKTGSASRSDRIAKYNQLLRIEEELGDKAFYPKKEAFNVDF
jgi:enolase